MAAPKLKSPGSSTLFSNGAVFNDGAIDPNAGAVTALFAVPKAGATPPNTGPEVVARVEPNRLEPSSCASSGLPKPVNPEW